MLLPAQLRALVLCALRQDQINWCQRALEHVSAGVIALLVELTSFRCRCSCFKHLTFFILEFNLIDKAGLARMLPCHVLHFFALCSRVVLAAMEKFIDKFVQQKPAPSK